MHARVAIKQLLQVKLDIISKLALKPQSLSLNKFKDLIKEFPKMSSKYIINYSVFESLTINVHGKIGWIIEQ